MPVAVQKYLWHGWLVGRTHARTHARTRTYTNYTHRLLIDAWTTIRQSMPLGREADELFTTTLARLLFLSPLVHAVQQQYHHHHRH